MESQYQQCKAVFGVYYCSVCVLIDNDVNKQIYHCEGCGICRIGARQNFFHCSVCIGCISIFDLATHQCQEGLMRSKCPICLEELFSSTKQCQAAKCGHYIHSVCLSEMLKANLYKCPQCCKALVNMQSAYQRLNEEISLVPMPEEYRDLVVQIHCNECNL